jgi:alkylation response protein AidB-like acyl-CoA dehydrogenase
VVDLALTESQLELQGVARRFLRSHAEATDAPAPAGPVGQPPGQGGGTPPLWREMGALGWLGLTIPSAHGGVGASAVDAGALYSELGRGPLAGPLFESAVLTPAIMLAADPAGAVFSSALAAIADGEMIVAPVLSATSAPPIAIDHVELELSGDRVRGRAGPVRHADRASAYLVLARTASPDGALACALVDASGQSVAARELPGFAPGQFEVEFRDAAVVGPPVPLGGAGLAAVAAAVVGALPVLCAFQVGSCQAVLDMTVAYSGDRMAFGKPIGTFQRVQDHVIEIVNALDSARWTTYHALWLSDTGGGAVAASHVAKAVTSEAHASACTHSHEVHAGIGTDLQYGLAVHTHLARTLYGYYGDPSWHRDRLADELGFG